jgi:asparagine synthase (glutamine-hydrolysing)
VTGKVCGLVATFGPAPVGSAELQLACRAIAHRGPDGEGAWSGRVGHLSADLGHRRLAIVDPSPAGSQPMLSADRTLAVTYNGELYNYPALRTYLEGRGHRFRTRCDTEALLHGYREWGVHLARHLEGMFAFVLVDQSDGLVIAARDRLGIKPLYWSRTGRRTSFASEPKALFFLDSDLQATADPLAMAAVLTLLWVPHPRTSFLRVEKLPPGHQVVLRDAQPRVERYWDLVEAWTEHRAAAATAGPKALASALQAAVDAQLLADVPVGVLLSGGLDSCFVLELMSRISRQAKIPTIAVGYEQRAQAYEFLPDDADWARRFASRVPAAAHDELILDGDHWKDADRLAWHLDDLVADPAALSMRMMAQAARSSAKVLLSGVGAEELLAGYPRYRALASIDRLRAMPLALRRAVRGLSRMVPASRPGPLLPLRRNIGKYAEVLAQPGEWFHFFSYHSQLGLGRLLGDAALANELFGWMHSREDRMTRLPARERATLVDLSDFLPNLNLSYVDKASMAASVEVRVPIVDERMVETAARLPEDCFVAKGTSKRGLKLAAEPFLPRDFIYRRKTGLGGPVRYWVAASMADALDDRVDDLAGRGWIDRRVGHELVEQHRRGRADRALACWAMFALSLWAERFVDTPRQRWLA